MIKQIMIYALLGFLFFQILSLNNPTSDTNQKPQNIPYSEFMELVEKDAIKKVTISGSNILAETSYNKKVTTVNTHDRKIIDDLLKKKVPFSMETEEKSGLILFLSILPHLLFFAILIYFLKNSGAGQGLFKQGFEILKKEDLNIKYSDVAGIDEVLEDVQTAVHNFADSQGLESLGGTPSSGILLTGQPGTGKTLLAKAIAGELNVNFIPISGSSFVELFVGNGARKVRKLFEVAKQNAPCIIFIDEIDAIGQDRNQQSLGSNDERLQTLNQLLVELDGFNSDEQIFVIAATNFHEKLDSALTRAGRFDKLINIPLPSAKGRKDIFKVHLKKTNELGRVDQNLDLEDLAKISSGFTGAQIENLVNESIAIAHKEKSTVVNISHFNKARDIILMGVENPNFMTREKDKEKTAYHEAGHAIVGLFTENHDPVEKVSIIPRGRALGVTLFESKDDRVSYSKQELNSMIQTLYGGRLAEELIYGEDGITTGASNDLERASDIAYNMVYLWGFSKNSVRSYHINNKNPYKDMISSSREHELEKEVDNILNNNYEKAKEILEKNKTLLENMKTALMEKETIDRSDIDLLIQESNS